MTSSAWGTALLGVALGMRHALEPDHLAAVSALAAEERGSRGGLRLGALWGVGHSLTLFVVAGTLSLLEARMPARASDTFELLVAVVLMALGVRAVRRSLQEGRVGPFRAHRHASLAHAHAAPPEHVHVFRWTLGTRSLWVGALHGLAGSGAMTALVVAEVKGSVERLTTLALFGLGSVLGMALLTGVLGVPLARLARSPKLAAAALGVVGLVSSTFGVWWGVEASRRLLGA